MTSSDFERLKSYLDEKVALYNQPEFIADDPICVPHLFAHKEDVEIAGFLTATIAWGNRKSIIKNARALMNLMDARPFDFVTQANENELKKLQTFVHRTFNGSDCFYFVQALRNIYLQNGGLEAILEVSPIEENVYFGLKRLRETFFVETNAPQRTYKHLSDVSAGSAAKRLNMWLRWLVRNNSCGVDFGLWKTIRPDQLICPLDVHSGRTARALGLLIRKQNDLRAALELTASLKKFDPLDPVKYDFALFGIGVFEKKFSD